MAACSVPRLAYLPTIFTENYNISQIVNYKSGQCHTHLVNAAYDERYILD